MQHEMQMGFRALSSSLSSQLQPLIQLPTALQQITTQRVPLLQHGTKQDETLKKQETELGKIWRMWTSSTRRSNRSKSPTLEKSNSPSPATSTEAALYTENGEEIRVSARKIELSFPTKLEKSAARGGQEGNCSSGQDYRRPEVQDCRW